MKDNRGVTLVELLVVLGLLGIVFFLIFLPVFFSQNSFSVQNERKNIISDARQTMDYLTRTIRKADQIEVVDEHTVIVDSIEYRLDNGAVYKGEQAVLDGIDDLTIKKNDKTVSIEIAIKDRKGEYYRLSSKISIR